MGPVEVCIVGGGMAGASVAFHLAPHARVTLLEREPHAGYHSSGRSAALYAPNYGSALIQRLTLAGESFLTEPPVGSLIVETSSRQRFRSELGNSSFR